jgi:hypothetical protein
MSWLDDLFGAKSKNKDASGHAQRTSEWAAQNLAEQRRLAQQGTDAARQSYGTGYGIARNALDGSKREAEERVNYGYDRAIDATRGYGQQGIDYYKQLYNDGRTSKAYNSYLGTGEGGAAEQAAYRTALNQRLTDENREALDYEAKTRDAALNAGRGGGSGGRAMLSRDRATTLALGGLREGEASRLERRATQEEGYLGRAADATMQLGQNLGNLERGRGLDQSNLSTGYGDRQAQYATNYYDKLGGLDTGRSDAEGRAVNDYYGNLSAADRYKTDASMSTRGTGMNNLAQWGGLALQGFTTGGRSGTSAFGNIKNTLWGKGLS